MCSPLNGRLVRVIRDSTAQYVYARSTTAQGNYLTSYRLAFLNIGAHLASEICKHYHFDDCAWWIPKIQWSINGIFAVAAGRGRASGGEGVSPDQELSSVGVRDLSKMSYGERIEEWLHDERFNYNHVEDVNIITLSHQKRNTDEPDLVYRAIVRGILNEGFTHDVAFNYYSNGGTVLHLGAMNQTLAANPSNLSKRVGFSQEGFKISFTTRRAAALTSAQQNDMANWIARDWATHVFAASDYIGLVKDGHVADFYYRIIPEVKGFGLNYETVDICGGMASLL